MQFTLAPMEEITGYVYRNVHRDIFGELDRYLTPFINPTQKKILKTKERKEIDPANNTGLFVVPQILTNQAARLTEAAEMLFSLGYREADLNLGCPSPTVVTRHRGAGFLADPSALDAFFEEVFSYPLFRDGHMLLSVKTRLGLFSPDEFTEILKVYNRHPISEVIIHPRVRTDFYRNAPDLDAFEAALETSAHPVCYNGDLFTREDFERFHARFPQVGRVMLGRGLIANPALVREIRTGEKLRKEELSAFEKALYDGYTESFHDANTAIYKMKEVWSYMGKMFEQPQKALKKVYKSRRPEEYRAAVSELFRTCEFLSSPAVSFS